MWLEWGHLSRKNKIITNTSFFGNGFRKCTEHRHAGRVSVLRLHFINTPRVHSSYPGQYRSCSFFFSWWKNPHNNIYFSWPRSHVRTLSSFHFSVDFPWQRFVCTCQSHTSFLRNESSLSSLDFVVFQGAIPIDCSVRCQPSYHWSQLHPDQNWRKPCSCANEYEPI